MPFYIRVSRSHEDWNTEVNYTWSAMKLTCVAQTKIDKPRTNEPLDVLEIIFLYEQRSNLPKILIKKKI